MYILCRNLHNRERKCAAASEYIFYVEDCVAASENISYFLRNVQLLLKDINKRLLLKETVQLLLNKFILVEDCVAASTNISMFFNEHAASS